MAQRGMLETFLNSLLLLDYTFIGGITIMASFKVCIADTKEGRTYQKEFKDAEAAFFLGMNLGAKVEGKLLGMEGFELVLTGGSDNCGFPMRKGIKGARKNIVIGGGVGQKAMKHGQMRKKTVCGNKVTGSITQLNLKVTTYGSSGVAKALGLEKEEKAAAPAQEEAKKE
ncbi:TPA: 30S ribosomal protein S6e [Candidatus Woesearchaeota archaeon]|nr:30S ribosomal protein S6e [Candidatus Woesearchaeota archaeon]